MLAGFLTTALEIVIILDVCGVVAYFVISGLARLRNSGDGGQDCSESPLSPSPLRPLAVEGPVLSPAPYYGAVPKPGLDIYAGPTPASAGGNEGFSVTAGLRRRLASLKGRLTYRFHRGSRDVETQEYGDDCSRLGRILDSFKEDS